MGFDLGNMGDMAKNAGQLSELPKLWDDVKDKDWHGFYERIQTARQNHEADDDKLDQLETAGKNAEASGEGFPHSLPDFTKVVSEHMPHK